MQCSSEPWLPGLGAIPCQACAVPAAACSAQAAFGRLLSLHSCQLPLAQMPSGE